MTSGDQERLSRFEAVKPWNSRGQGDAMPLREPWGGGSTPRLVRCSRYAPNMGNDALAKGVEVAGNAFGELVKLGKESPEAREAGAYAAKSVKIIAQTIHTVLLPLAAANYGAQKFSDYMRSRFAPELQERLDSVPEENIIEPRAVLAGPALDALVYAHEDDDLRRLYLSLLASAMDSRIADDAHPAFIELLRQVDSDEIAYLRAVYQGVSGITPIARLRLTSKDGSGSVDAATHVLDWREAGAAFVPPRSATYVDNWVRLGLVEVMYDTHLTALGAYDWVTERPEYVDLDRSVVDLPEGNAREIEPQHGVLRITSLGAAFARAVRIDDAPEDAVRRELGDWTVAVEKREREKAEAERAESGASQE